MSKLLINEPALQVLPSLAVAVGLNEAIFIQQLHYWLQKSQHERKARKWVYNTYEQWQVQFPFWAIRTIKRIVESLKEQKVLIVDKLQEGFGMQVNWYSIDYEQLDKLEVIHRSEPKVLAAECQNGTTESDKMAQSRSCQNGTTIVPKCHDVYKVSETTNRDKDNNRDVVVDKSQKANRAAGNEISKLATSLGVDHFVMDSLLQRYDQDIVFQKLKMLSQAKGVTNPTGWLKKSLEEGYKQDSGPMQPLALCAVRSVEETQQYFASQPTVVSTVEGRKQGMKSLKAALGGFKNAH